MLYILASIKTKTHFGSSQIITLLQHEYHHQDFHKLVEFKQLETHNQDIHLNFQLNFSLIFFYADNI